MKTNFMMTEPPLVTIGIPTLNRPEMLVKAVQSVLAQSYRNLEVVVCDNASNPPSRAALEPFLHDARLRYVYCEEQVGMVANWNRCLNLAKGDLWLCLSDDDWLEPDAVEKMTARFGDEAVGMSVCSRYVETEKGSVLAEVPGDGVVSGGKYIDDRLLGRGVGCPAAEMFRTMFMRKMNGYQEIGFAMDLLLELDAGVAADVAYIKKPLVHYAIHCGNASVTRSVEYIQSHVVLGKLAQARYKQQVADKVRQYCIRAIYGRLKGCSFNKDSMAVNTGLNALVELNVPFLMKMKACAWSLPPVQFMLNRLRTLKRQLKRNCCYE